MSFLCSKCMAPISLRVKAKLLMMASTVLQNLDLLPLWLHQLFLPLAHSTPASLATFFFLEHAKHTLAFAPLTFQVFSQLSPLKWHLSWPLYVKSQLLHLHILKPSLLFFLKTYCVIYPVFMFIVYFPLLECKCNREDNFSLFCSLVYPKHHSWHIESTE